MSIVTPREWFTTHVLPACRAFDKNRDFKNITDVNFLFAIPSFEFDLYDAFQVRTAFKNMCIIRDFTLDTLTSDKVCVIDAIQNGTSNLIIDYNREGFHYHVYVPTTFPMDSENRVDWNCPIVDTMCPICYDTIDKSAAVCCNCGRSTCYDCVPYEQSKNGFLFTKCCMCRWTPDPWKILQQSLLTPYTFSDIIHTTLELYFTYLDLTVSSESVLKIELDLTKDQDVCEYLQMREQQKKFSKALASIYNDCDARNRVFSTSCQCLVSRPCVEFDLTTLRQKMQTIDADDNH